MRRQLALTVLLAAATALAQDDGGGEASVFALTGAAAGVAYDSNITRSAAPQGDVAFDATANGGVGWAPGDTWALSVLALYSGRTWATAPELSTHVLSALGLVTLSPVDWLTLGLAPSGGYTLAVDSARQGPRFDARGFVQLRPVDWLRVRAGYGYLVRGAVDPVFATQTHEGSARVRFVPLDWLQLSFASSLAWGDDVIYRDVGATGVTTTAQAGRGARWSAGGTTFEPQRVLARTVTASAEVEFVLPAGFSVAADVTWVTSDNPVQPWSAWVPSLLVAWDLP